MKISKVLAVWFSPAGSTRLAAARLARELAGALDVPAEELDITPPAARQGVVQFAPDELAVFASPTYAGRLPNKLLPFFQSGFRAQGAPAVPLVTFGNRSFQDSLSELSLVLRESGFVPVGAASIVSRHVFTPLLAPGQPDESSLSALDGFARALAQQLKDWDEPRPVTVPGNDPPGPYYTPLGTDGQPAKFLKAKPQTSGACVKCGACAAACPMGSIDRDDPAQVPGICIKCQACVKTCPLGAKHFDDPAFLSHVAMLEQNYTDPKESRFYLP